MNQVLLKRDKGPVVQIGEKVKGCIIITQSPEGTVSIATDGLSLKEETAALERALAFAKEKKNWKSPRKEKKTDSKNPNITRETWSFENPAQGKHFALQMALAGLPMGKKPVQ